MNKLSTIALIGSALFMCSSQATLLDKVAGVVNDKVYTLSEITRVKNTLSIRKEIAPYLYTMKGQSSSDVLSILQNSYIIKDKLSELGFVVSDDAVESRIKQTEKGLRLTRPELLKFLNSKGISFSEYHEILRQAMEHSIFQRRIIAPLVTITDQELKNYYYKMNSSNKSLSFNYKVVDFVIDEKLVLKSDLKRLPEIFETYKKTGIIPAIYNSVSKNDLGLISEEDLPKQLSKVLKSTNEKSFSKLYISDGIIHSFYLEEKNLAESSDYLQKRAKIQNEIFLQRSKHISQNWFSREALNYYTVNNI